MKRVIIPLLLVLLACSCYEKHQDEGYGPYWSYSELRPVFTVQPTSVSTSFNGHVAPPTRFVFGGSDGFACTKPNMKVSIIANAVWAYQPLVVALYDGPFDSIGSAATLIAEWVVPPPEHGGAITLSESRNLGGRTGLWLLVDLPEFSGNCTIEALGYD